MRHAVLAGQALLRRNYEDLTFCPQDNEADLRESKRRTLSAVREKLPGMLVYDDPLSLSPAEKARLLEKGLLPPSFESLTQAALAAEEDETLSVAVNTGEHVLIQAQDQEGELSALTARLRQMEAELSLPEYPYAHDARFGYLSFNPVLAGSGLYAALVMHLPMLNFLKQIRALEGLVKQRFHCRLSPLSVFEGGNPGNLFVLGNAGSFQKEDEEIISLVEQAAGTLAEKEAALREKAFLQTRVTPLADQAWRAYGTLRYARRLTTRDYLSLWSKMRLGALAGILPVPHDTADRMLIFGGDSRYLTQGAEQKLCPFRRADEVRQALSGGEHAHFRKV